MDATTDRAGRLKGESGFGYSPIDAKNAIRLLRLAPATNGDGAATGAASFSLETVALSALASIDYRAVSYTGDEDGAGRDGGGGGEIILDGAPFRLGRGLHHFMRTAAGRAEYGLYFVDAICVDAAKASERAAAVLALPLVLRAARRVIVWLGIPDTDEVAANVEALSRATRRQGAADKGDNGRGRGAAGEAEDHERAAAMQLDGYRYLSQHPHWSRVWAVQAVQLARRVEVWCGFDTFAAELLGSTPVLHGFPFDEARIDGFAGLAARRRVVGPPQSAAHVVVSHRQRQVLRPRRGPDRLVGSMAELTGALRRPAMEVMTYTSPVADRLYDVIRKFGRFEAADASDRLYGFLGLLDERTRAQIRVDYERGAAFAFRQALAIGIEEIWDEQQEQRDDGRRTRPDRGRRTYYAFLAELKQVFGVSDEAALPILRDVLAELQAVLGSATWNRKVDAASGVDAGLVICAVFEPLTAELDVRPAPPARDGRRSGFLDMQRRLTKSSRSWWLGRTRKQRGWIPVETVSETVFGKDR